MSSGSRVVSILSAAGLACTSVPPTWSQARSWTEIQKPPLRQFTPQQPRRIALPNGMVIFLQENHELPLIGGRLRIRGGSRNEDGGKVGLANLFGMAWRTGGTRGRTGDELDDFLEARAAGVETGSGIDSTSVSFNCLKENFDEVFAVFVELLKTPEFRQDKLDLAKQSLRTDIARRNDEPTDIVDRETDRVAYGASSPYGRIPEYATVAAVNRDDLVAWHKRYVHPNNMVLGVSGDFDARKLEATLRKAFGGWPQGPAAAKPSAEFKGPKPGVYLVAKDDVNQSSIRLVHMGATRDNPDYYALTVMNEVFGGGFAARLFSNVRSKKGLAYAVYGGVGMSWDYPGLFSVTMYTKSQQTAQGIDALLEEIANLHQTPATAGELQRAKESLLNSFIFRVDSKDKILGEKMALELHGYPLDRLEKYRAGIEQVTAADIARVARKYVQRDKLAIVVVGKSADFDRPLSSFGSVTPLDITIPEPGSAGKVETASPVGVDS